MLSSFFAGNDHRVSPTWHTSEDLALPSERTCFSPETLQSPLVPPHFRAIRCASPLSTFPTRNNARFLHGPGRAKLCRKSLDFRYIPEPRFKCVFQNPRHANTMKQDSNGSTGQISWEEHELCRSGSEIIPATLFPARTSCRILVRTSGCVTSHWLQTSCGAHRHVIPDDLTLLPRSQVHRTRRTYFSQSSACELTDSQFNNPSTRCASAQSLIRSVRGRERWSAARRLPCVVSCDNAESSSPTSFFALFAEF